MMSKLTNFVLTGERFEDLDFSESVLNLNYGALPSSTMHVAAWGILFHLKDHPFLLPSGSDACASLGNLANLPSWSIITFEGVSKVEIRVAPYAPSFTPTAPGFLSKSGLAQDHDSMIELFESWEVPGQPLSAQSYGFDCVLDHPYGYCSLIIRASGAVGLEFRPDLLIPFSEFHVDPKKFGWWENGRLRV
jgi:hypothetical protein